MSVWADLTFKIRIMSAREIGGYIQDVSFRTPLVFWADWKNHAQKCTLCSAALNRLVELKVELPDDKMLLDRVIEQFKTSE